MSLTVKGICRTLIRDMGVKKLHVCSWLWGMALGLLWDWDTSVRGKLWTMWTSFLIAMTLFAIIGVVRQHRRHKRFDLEWKEAKARADHAVAEGDYEGVNRHVATMDRLLEENFGVEKRAG